jgi:hypothetical protein
MGREGAAKLEPRRDAKSISLAFQGIAIDFYAPWATHQRSKLFKAPGKGQ